MAEAFGLTYRSLGLSLKSELLLSSKAQYGFVPNLIHHCGKNHRPSGLKTIYRKTAGFTYDSPTTWFFSGAKRHVVFASCDVLRCETTSDDGRGCARACSQAQSHDISTKARRAKTT